MASQFRWNCVARLCSGLLLAAGVLGVAGGLAEQASAADGTLAPARLRCECLDEPLGVDRQQPELSWIVASPERDQVQSAYRILVASSAELLADDQADLWDSGKVNGSETFAIDYQGKPLPSHETCYWKVQAWDGDDRPGPWSTVTHWSMGILNPAEWPGEWIGYDAARQAYMQRKFKQLEGANWIAHAADEVLNAPAGTRIYHRTTTLPAGVKIDSATMTVCADDVVNVYVNDRHVATTRDPHQPCTVDVRADLREGANDIRIVCRNFAPGPAGICVKLTVASADDADIILISDDQWTSSVGRRRRRRAPSAADAEPVQVIGPYGCEPWGYTGSKADIMPPPAYLRNDFALTKPVARATVYLAALGWADLSINGQLVNADYFSSGWTDYRKRVYYRAYDVTGLLKEGPNAWGAVLADGWFSGRIGWSADRDHYGKNPRVRASLHVEYADGTTGDFATDDSWTAIEGPTTVADILIGEEYDATREQPGWDAPGFASENASPVALGAEVAPVIQWHPGPPVVEIAEFPATSVTEPKPGVYVFDIGQYIAGVARLQIRGRSGQQIQLRFAERLNDDGTVYTTNLRQARCIDRYTCRGDGLETWQPRQTFHGYQYVELTGVDERPDASAVTGVALTSHAGLASEFDCSDDDLNRLYQNVLWTQRANFIDVPTDCPQRDERLGWTGDAQVYVHTACLAADVQSFFRKWLVDLEDAQRADGQFPRVAPVVLREEDGGPAWADAGVICPWEIYQVYGDEKLLAQQYPSMVRFVEFTRNRSRDGVLPPERFHCFGDWLSVKADTPKEVIYTAYHARSADLLRRAAEVLGHDDDARKYGELFEQIKAAFQREFVNDQGVVRGDTQCCYVLAIGYGLVDGPQRDAAARRLVADIEARGNRLSTGFIGTKDLMLVLSEIGREDVALKLLHQREYPGWLFSISHGATSIWERWDGWTPDKGFQDPGMNSFAHYSFGAVYGWMVENLGGIRSNEPGFGRLTIDPTFDPLLEHCRVKYDSIRGPIETTWQNSANRRQLVATIPANVRATVVLHGVSLDEIQVDGAPLAEAGLDGQESTGPQGELVVKLDVPSGTYEIAMPVISASAQAAAASK